jgi:hypothetical protein
MDTFTSLIGKECDLDHVNDALREHLQSLGRATVGALHVTCSDEAEYECVKSFQERVVRYLLPELKYFQKLPMNTTSLGGRYEWGSVAVAEDHYAQAGASKERLILVVKINTHVALEQTEGGGRRYGTMLRYGRQSCACGALHAMLDGAAEPFANQLREVFQSEGVDRVASLLDEKQVDPQLRSLLVAVAGTRLQARTAMLDIQEHEPTVPTTFLIVPCVTLNRRELDTELLCGLYRADSFEGQCAAEYTGLGDDPSQYQVDHDRGRLSVSDTHAGTARAARDHRDVVRQKWRQRSERSTIPQEHVREVLDEAKAHLQRDHKYAGAILKTLVNGLASLSPVTAAVVLFSEGLADLYHAHRAYKLADELAADDVARRILDDVHHYIDRLDSEHARKLVELLIAEYER